MCARFAGGLARRKTPMTVVCEDDAGSCELVCLQKPFLPDAFVAGDRVMLGHP
jgi:hypothetical protein